MTVTPEQVLFLTAFKNQNNNTENSGVHYAMKMDTHATLTLMRIKKVNITVS